MDPPLLIERDGDPWLQHPDGLWDGPVSPGDDEPLVVLEREGTLGHTSVCRGEDALCPAVP